MTYQRLGPILLTPGISRANAGTKFYADFISVAMFTGMAFLQAYILTEHLNIPRRAQGVVSGDLAFWTEIATILLFYPFGMLADHIGRRPVYVFGISAIGIGYGLFPFAQTTGELMAYRLIYALGLAAAAGTLATLSNDYPQESSRGKLIGITSMVNILGNIFMALIIGRIPAWMTAQGYDAVTSGKVMFLFAAGLCVITAVVARFGLAGGTPVEPRHRAGFTRLITSGLRATRNPRILLAYGAAFAARSDLVIKGMFLALWAVHDGAERGMSPAAAMARFGLMIVIMQAVSLISAPVFGWFIDQVNRVTATIVALVFASAGYLSMGIITSPLDFAMVPYFIVIALGSGFILKSSLALVGQEAPVTERGTVIAMSSVFGAIGILVFTKLGGKLFDDWGPWAPFVIAGAYQVFLLVAAVIIRITAPGSNMLKSQGTGPARVSAPGVRP